MLKYDFYSGWYLPSNGTVANVVLHDLDLNFEGQTFQVAILTSYSAHLYWQYNSDKIIMFANICKQLQ